MTKNVTIMNAVSPTLPIHVTEIATKCTVFKDGVRSGNDAPEKIGYAFREIDNLCGVIAAGATSAFLWQLATPEWDPTNTMALYRPDGTKRPHHAAFSAFANTLPTNGTIYVDDPLAVGDQTIKALVISNDRFGLVLSRYQDRDRLGGALNISINTLQEAHLTFANIHVTAFPATTDVSGVTTRTRSSAGNITLSLANLPYNAIVFVTGAVLEFKTC